MASTAFTPAWLEAHRVDITGVGAADIVGIGHVLREIDSLLARLRAPALLAELGAALPRGILFFGPPGTGKTLTARYLASQLGTEVPLYECSADELSPQRIKGALRYLSARHLQSVLFLDEIDGFALARDAESHTDATRDLLTAFLAALDGLVATPGPIVIAASNRPPMFLDRALVRAGRLGVRIRFSEPDQAEREALFARYAAGRRIAGSIDWREPAALTRGQTPADLRAVLDDALGLALVAGRRAISLDDVLAAIRRNGDVLPERGAPDPVSDWIIAVHEAGHVCVASVLDGPDWVTAVMFGALGGTTAVGPEERGFAVMPDHRLRDAIRGQLGGWAAELLILGEASSGCDQDLSGATAQILGRIDAFLETDFPPLATTVFAERLPETLKTRLAEVAEREAASARAEVLDILRPNRAAVERFARTFLEARELTGEALRAAITEARFVDLDGKVVG